MRTTALQLYISHSKYRKKYLLAVKMLKYVTYRQDLKKTLINISGKESGLRFLWLQF